MRDLKKNECPRCMEEYGKFVKGKKLSIHTENFGSEKFYTIYKCPKGHKWNSHTTFWHDISLSWLCPKCAEKEEYYHGKGT